MRNFIVLLLVNIININAFSKYYYTVENINFDNYGKKIKQFEINRKNTPDYWYYYGVLYKKIILLNLVSNKLNYFIEEMKSKLSTSIKFNNKKYKIYSLNEFIFMHNLFLERGCEYIKIKKYDEAIKSFNIAKTFYDNVETDIKIAFSKQLKKEYTESINIYNTCIEKTTDKKLINEININLINIYIIKKDFDKVKKIIVDELKKDNYNIKFLEILSKLKYKYNIEINNLLSNDKKIYDFQTSVIYYFNKSYKEAFNLLDKLNLKRTEQLILFSDVIYNYSIFIQENTNDESTLRMLINKNIKLCNKILKLDGKNIGIAKRLLTLQLSIRDYKNAEKTIKKQ